MRAQKKVFYFSKIGIFLLLTLKRFLTTFNNLPYQTKLIRLAIVLLIVCTYQTIILLNSNFANIIFYAFFIIGMLVIGIPHGAVEHLLERRKKINLYQFIIKYVLIVFAYYLIWQLIPLLAICFFIIYSAFHFGESELKEIDEPINSVKNYLFSFIIGFSTLTLIITSHYQETINLVTQINGLQFILNYIKYFNLFETPLLVASIFTLLIIALYFNKISLYFLLIILLLAIATPLIFAFGIYFICQHSINAWQHLKQELLISNKNLLKEAFPFTFAAVIFFVAIVLISYLLQSQDINILKSQFFIFLACISLPHVLLMHNFYKKQN